MTIVTAKAKGAGYSKNYVLKPSTAKSDGLELVLYETRSFKRRHWLRVAWLQELPDAISSDLE